jgi:hypothetical protein
MCLHESHGTLHLRVSVFYRDPILAASEAADSRLWRQSKFLLDHIANLCRNSVLKPTQQKDVSMLWTIIVILIVLWLLGFIGHFGGALIHLLLVIAVIILIINLLQGRRGL